MKNLDKIIDDINWQVWNYNPNFNERRENTSLVETPEVAFELIETYCKVILKNKNKKIIDNAIDSIEKICYGEIVPETIKIGRRLRGYKGIAEIILKYAKEGINLCKSLEDTELVELNNKYRNRYLYFEGYESGSVIIWITDISYKGDNIVWSGSKIGLGTENTSSGLGVTFDNIKEESFEDLPYYDNIYDIDIDGKTYSDGSEWEENYIKLLDKWLSENHGESRELTLDDIKKYIEHHLHWGFYDLGLPENPYKSM